MVAEGGRGGGGMLGGGGRAVEMPLASPLSCVFVSFYRTSGGVWGVPTSVQERTLAISSFQRKS